MVYHDGSVPYLSFEVLDKMDFIINGFSTRLGGVSSGEYESMNLTFTRGDDSKKVSENFRRIANALGVRTEDMVYAAQTHTTNVLKVGASHKGMGIVRERNFHDIDGLITDEPGVCLVTSYADCVPLYIVDTVHRAIGLSHSGWRGTVNGIGAVTLMAMQEAYGTRAEDVIVCIGPSICKNCYEVGEDVAGEFAQKYDSNQQKDIIFSQKNNKFLLDLQAANRHNFMGMGVNAKNIFMPDLCTCCRSELLYSHRASKGRRGGLCGFLQIK